MMGKSGYLFVTIIAAACALGILLVIELDRTKNNGREGGHFTTSKVTPNTNGKSAGGLDTTCNSPAHTDKTSTGSIEEISIDALLDNCRKAMDAGNEPDVEKLINEMWMNGEVVEYYGQAEIPFPTKYKISSDQHMVKLYGNVFTLDGVPLRGAKVVARWAHEYVLLRRKLTSVFPSSYLTSGKRPWNTSRSPVLDSYGLLLTGEFFERVQLCKDASSPTTDVLVIWDFQVGETNKVGEFSIWTDNTNMTVLVVYECSSRACYTTHSKIYEDIRPGNVAFSVDIDSNHLDK